MSQRSIVSPIARLTALRALMRASVPPVVAYIVPSSDEHQSEYVPARDKRREWLSGFSGSAGTAVVTATSALLWTDARYFLQAEAELDKTAGWSLMKDREPNTPTPENWLASAASGLAKGDSVGADPRLFSVNSLRRMSRTLAAANINLQAPQGGDFIDTLWGGVGSTEGEGEGEGEGESSQHSHSHTQPLRSTAPLRAHPARVAGETTREKLTRVRKAMSEKGALTLLVTALDDVAWLFNVRGADVECCPVALAFALITPLNAILCIDVGKVDAELGAMLLSEGVDIRPYDAFPTLAAAAPRPVWLDPGVASGAAWSAVAGDGAGGGNGSLDAAPLPLVIVEAASPITLMKAKKNKAERDGMAACHVRDGAALIRFFAWLEVAAAEGIDLRIGAGAPLAEPLTEYTASEALDGFRANIPDFVSTSFPSIVGWRANGAIVHYRPERATAARIEGRGVLLVDSGGQYIDGTTDVTRTVCLGGKPTAAERRAWTAVLQGHIALARAVFPAGTGGVALDALARAPLWRCGLDYKHGTGHGVGAALNVHEGPHGLANVPRGDYAGGLHAHFTITDEPGYYETGNFGIRIENVMIVAEVTSLATEPSLPGGGGTNTSFLCLDTLTMVPLGGSLLDASMLTAEERAWLNEYNARAVAAVAPLLSDATDDALALRWLYHHAKAV